MGHELEARALRAAWGMDARWTGITRPYTAEDVLRLRGSITIQHTLATLGAKRLWESMNRLPYVQALGALTGNQALQQVKAGLPAIYLSGWQVAADANLAGQMYPDQSLYPANSVPAVVKRINQCLQRADQIHRSEGRNSINWYVPIVADAEAGFGGPLNAFELMKAMIEAGAAGVHFEDQLAAEKKCGHLGGKVLVPTSQFIKTLVAARLAADVLDVPTILIARTDADSAKLLLSDIDERDRQFMTGERTPDGFHRLGGGLDQAIARGLAYAPYADLLWCETSTPNLDEARCFAARAVPAQTARLQLLPVLQLEARLGRRDHRRLPARAGRDGLQVPVHHVGGLPRAQPRHVRPRARVSRRGDAGLRPAPGARVREHGGRLHRRPAPARGRHRVLRPGAPGDRRRRERHGRAARLDRGGAVSRGDPGPHERSAAQGLLNP
jgi:isocitrate lyase